MSFLSSLFSKKSKPAKAEPKQEIEDTLDPKIKAAVALMKTTEAGKEAVKLLKNQNLIATPDAPFPSFYNALSNKVYIDSSLNPADIAVGLAGTARQLHHKQVLTKMDMVEMKAADGVQCYRLMQADAEAHKALMYYALKSNEALPYFPELPAGIIVHSVLIQKAMGASDEKALGAAVKAFYNDHQAVQTCDLLYTRDQHLTAYNIDKNPSMAPGAQLFSKDMPDKAFEKICSVGGVPYVKQEEFNQTPFRIMNQNRRNDISRMVALFSKDTSIMKMPTFEEIEAKNAIARTLAAKNR